MSDRRIYTASEGGYATFIDVLRSRAEHRPEDVAYTFVGSGQEDGREITFGGLDRRARVIASHLQDAGIAPGSRALILYQPGLEYIGAFLGCLYAGVVAVPAYPPRLNRPVDRLKVIATDSEADVVLTHSRVLAGLEKRFQSSPELEALHWIATDTLLADDSGWRSPQIEADSLAFLQYTSGSTASPKGVMVTHANLLHNSESIYRGLGHTSRSHMVSWLPPYHDMGLIGVIIQSLYGGFRATLLSPGAFLQRPLSWLELISDLGADSAGGPNFAYELCARKTTPSDREGLDLSAWRVAFCGAEPIRKETLDNFAAAFEPCGFRADAFYPGYGLAEATLFVSGGERGSGSTSLLVDSAELEQGRVVTRGDVSSTKSRPVVGCGRAIGGQDVAIVDPESHDELPDDEIGEIWVSGPSVTEGYWGRPEETGHVFGAYVASTGDGPYLRTGDLGFLHDRELFVTGRLKDLIIIRGRNHYPQDIEYTVESCHEAFRSGGCAAFSTEIDGEQKLVIVAELERRYVRQSELGEVTKRARRAVASEHEVEVRSIALIRTGSLPLTSSGKVQRRATREKYLSGELKVVMLDELQDGEIPPLEAHSSTEESDSQVFREDPTEERRLAVLSYVRSFARRRGNAETITVEDSLRVELSLDSLAIAELAVELESAFEVAIGESLLSEIETVGELCDLVASSGRVQPDDPMTSSLSDLREQITRGIPQVGVVVEEQRSRNVKIEGRWCTDFASANYLGLDLHPEVIAAIPEALREWGVHPSWTRAVASPKIYEDLERDLASFVGAKTVLAFPTITLLHAGVLPVLAGGDGAILLDQLAHNSLQEAAQLARSRGTSVDWFDHNDPESLERQLARYGRHSRKIVAVDGVYSMSGTYAPLRDYIGLARQYDATLYVDDAHGFGVVGERPGSRNPYGRRGNGIVNYYGLDCRDDIVYVGGMSKAFSSMVAFVTCRDPAEKERFAASSTAVFSGPAPIASLASALAGLKVSDTDEGEELRQRLLQLTGRLIAGARDLGFEVENKTAFPLVNVEIGSTREVIRACHVLWEDGILITPAIFPAAPIDRGGLRFTITSANTAEQVDKVLASLERVTSNAAVKTPR